MPGKKFVITGAILLFLLTACTGTPQYTDYYVSVLGSNSTGNGSNAKPWRTIQYALDHANYVGSKIVTINLAKGIYNENIVIDEEVIIRGAGSSKVVSTTTNPEIPVQKVSVIARQIPANIPNSETVKSVYAIGAGTVRLENLNVFGGGVTAEDSDFEMENVIVNGVTGFYGVQVTDSSFSILNSRIETQAGYYSDYGFNIIASSGFFTNSYVGDHFDHVINIIPWGPPPAVDLYNLPTPINIYITGAIIEGSPIYWADGIRIQGPADVIIQGSKITRAAGGEVASSGIAHNTPYAGIEVNGWMIDGNKMRRVEILNTNISGYDVGIGLNLETYELKVQGSAIQGVSYGVKTAYNTYTGSGFPTVDFGGGPLGSQGKNVFSNLPKYAFDHDTGPYDVSACYNTWQVLTSQIDKLRIYDKLDKPSLGRVKWDCLGSPAGTSQAGLEVVIPTKTLTPTPTITGLVAIPLQNANCRLGNSASMFDIADTLFAGEQYTPVSRGRDNLWLAFIGPTYGARCWVYVDNLTLLVNSEETDLENIPEDFLPVVPYPPRPTPTFTPEPEEAEPLEPAPDLPACSDGIDNDGDGLIDMADGRCLSPDGDFEG